MQITPAEIESPPAKTAAAKTAGRRKRSDPRRMPVWLFIPYLLATIGIVVVFARQGDFVTAVSALLVSFCGSMGFRMGMGSIAATLTGLAVAIVMAPSLAMPYEASFSERFGTTGLTNRLLCIATVGVLISLVVTMVAIVLFNWILGKRRKLHWANSFAGFGFGLLEGVFVVWLMLGAAISIQLWQRDAGMEREELNKVGLAVDYVASETRQSALGPPIVAYNPFERIGPLASVAELHHAVHNLSQDGNLDRLLSDDSVAELRDDPSVQSAIDEIRSDPVIQKVIEQKAPIDREVIARLMEHPAVLELVDNPEFVQRAREIVQSMQ